MVEPFAWAQSEVESLSERAIQLTKSTNSWKSFAHTHTTLYVVLRNVQFQPAKIMSSCTNSKETKLKTVLPLAIHLQRANLAPAVGRQQEPSLVALNEDQRTREQRAVWETRSSDVCDVSTPIYRKHSSCASGSNAAMKTLPHWVPNPCGTICTGPVGRGVPVRHNVPHQKERP